MRLKKLRKKLEEKASNKELIVLKRKHSSYWPEYKKGYILEIISNYVLMLEFNDFYKEGYALYSISDFKKIRDKKRDRKYLEILRSENYVNEKELTRYSKYKELRTLLENLKSEKETIIVQKEKGKKRLFLIGTISRLGKKQLWINHFSATGKLSSKPIGVKLKSISSISIKNNYSEVFKKYVEKK